MQKIESYNSKTLHTRQLDFQQAQANVYWYSYKHPYTFDCITKTIIGKHITFCLVSTKTTTKQLANITVSLFLQE